MVVFLLFFVSIFVGLFLGVERSPVLGFVNLGVAVSVYGSFGDLMLLRDFVKVQYAMCYLCFILSCISSFFFSCLCGFIPCLII